MSQAEINKIKLTSSEVDQYGNVLNKTMPEYVTLKALHNRRLTLEKEMDTNEWMIQMISSPEEEKAKVLRALRLELHERQRQLKSVKKLYWQVRKRHVLSKSKRY